MTRLARYRALLARIEPTDPKDFAGQPEIYVPPPSALPRKLATALALQPARSHLLVGPIGSGKTTTLRRAVDALREQVRETHDHVEYIDVSLEHQLDKEPLEGVLIALAGRSLITQVDQTTSWRDDASLASALLQLSGHAKGYTEWLAPGERIELQLEALQEMQREATWDRMDIQGALRPRILSPSVAHLEAPLRIVHEALGNRQCVFFFDSLDRLEKSDRFREAVAHDLPVLQRAGIGAVVVGPARFAFSKDRSVADLFDEIHVVQTANAESPEGLTFLSKVLRSRASAEMVPDHTLALIAAASGGILRDLLSVATRAARDAYDQGHEFVTESDAEDAATSLGGSKAVGLDASSLELLRQVRAGQPFVLDDKRLHLVERGQVVQTEVGVWKVHPALAMFLASASKAA